MNHLPQNQRDALREYAMAWLLEFGTGPSIVTNYEALPWHGALAAKISATGVDYRTSRRLYTADSGNGNWALSQEALDLIAEGGGE